MSLNVNDCEFLLSAVKQSQYPKHILKEVALVGRSNVGKSSLINNLVNRRNFARTSNQPGRTQTINFYRIDKLSLVDLPGYGFAKVPESVRQKWRPMIEEYLKNRKNLIAVLHLIDIRHKPTSDDEMMAEWIRYMQIPAWIVATKADKIAKSKHNDTLQNICDILQLPGIAFSATKKTGKPELIGILKEFQEKY